MALLIVDAYRKLDAVVYSFTKLCLNRLVLRVSFDKYRLAGADSTMEQSMTCKVYGTFVLLSNFSRNKVGVVDSIFDFRELRSKI